MPTLRWLLAVTLFASVSMRPGVSAGELSIPSDIAVALTASPDVDLVPGEPITFSVSTTNLGPEPVNLLLLISSDFYDQFGPSDVPNDCPGLVVVVSDGETFHYNFWWYPTDAGILAVGETRVCPITLTLTSQAPPTMQFSFGLPYFITDLNPANDSATVTLRRAIAAAAPIPALSPATLLVLTALLAACGGIAQRRLTLRS